jgi:Fe-S-cluster containining protein
MDSKRLMVRLEKFKCLKCGNCCKLKGQVYLFPRDVKKISKFLNIPFKSFINKYCRPITEYYIFKKKRYREKWLVLKKKKDRCVFLKKNICAIYKARPFYCKIAPFSERVLNNKKTLKYFLKNCRACQSRDIISKDKRLESLLKREEKIVEQYERILERNKFDLEMIYRL